MSLARWVAVALAPLSIAACGSSSPKDAGSPMGAVKFRFQVSDNAKMDPNLKSPLLGNVYGSVYLQEDVTISGPRNDAMMFPGVEVDGVDLRTATLSDQSFTSGNLAPNNYVFLGFYDVNGDGATSMNPDSGDPVTLPMTNQFTITDGVTTDRIVVFDLIYN